MTELAGLKTKWAAKTIHYEEQTVSTNEDAKKWAKQGAEHGTLLIADTQTGGKGRRGRTWYSEKGTTIAMTLICRPDFPLEKTSMLTLVMGLAVADAIEELTSLSTQIKWPNDIVVNGKKVCGILAELGSTMHKPDYLIIGVGINVNTGAHISEDAKNTFEEHHLENIATSLYLETGKKYSREELIALCMEKFETYYERFVRDLDLHDMRDDYNRLLAGKDCEVRVLDPQGEYVGISRGIDDTGNLLVEANGELQKVYAGEVSVRGLYGYV